MNRFKSCNYTVTNVGAHLTNRVPKDKPLRYSQQNGGGAGNRTRVQTRSSTASTCVAGYWSSSGGRQPAARHPDQALRSHLGRRTTTQASQQILRVSDCVLAHSQPGLGGPSGRERVVDVIVGWFVVAGFLTRARHSTRHKSRCAPVETCSPPLYPVNQPPNLRYWAVLCHPAL